MKKYITTIGIILISYLIVANLICLCLPYFYGNAQYTEKIDILKKTKTYVNTIFIGNSRVNRHIDPNLFNEMTGLESFNLGSDATTMVERLYLAEHAVKEDKNIEKIVVLTGHSLPIRKVNLHTIRSVYYHDWSRLLFTVSYRRRDKVEMVKHIFSFIENKFCLFRLKYALKNKRDYGYTVENRGFLPLDVAKKSTKGGQNPIFAKGANKHIERLSKDARKGLSEKPLNWADNVIIDECLAFQDRMRNKGVDVYFLFLPNNPMYREDLPLENVIFHGTGREFPHFYDYEMRYDIGHLNSKGAYQFTKKLAEIFNDQFI